MGRNGQAGKARASGVGRPRGIRRNGLAGAPVVEHGAVGTPSIQFLLQLSLLLAKPPASCHCVQNWNA
ncbi:MAG: hypothetical protein ABL921_08380 [Pirellula sp.]